MEESFFNHQKCNVQSLLEFGFIPNENEYIYHTDLLNGQLHMTVSVIPEGEIKTKIIDVLTNEEYILHHIAGASGTFVGQVREEYETVLKRIATACFKRDAFKSKSARSIIQYVSEVYGDTPEYLWQHSDNAVWRRQDNAKWYGALLTVSGQKLGLNTEENIEILDLRIKPEQLETLIDRKRFFPGYHMNKKHWYTVLLDGSIPSDTLFCLIDESYRIAGRKNKK